MTYNILLCASSAYPNSNSDDGWIRQLVNTGAEQFSELGCLFFGFPGTSGRGRTQHGMALMTLVESIESMGLQVNFEIVEMTRDLTSSTRDSSPHAGQLRFRVSNFNYLRQPTLSQLF